MNGVLGLCELLASARAPGVDLDQLHTLRASAQELLRIVEQLIDFVRLEEGRLPLASETFRPDAELRAAVVAARLEVETTSASELSELVPVRVAIAPGAGRAVQGDARRVRQLVRALVSNALRFSHQGAVDVALTRERDLLVVEVRDGGPGISDARIALVFQPFHAERSRRGLGVGLGLATAKRLAERMGGALTIQSAVGGGTRVRLEVPVAPPPGAALGAPKPRLGRGDRVLVVDDDATNRHVAALMLARLGLEADGIASGAEAVEVALRGGHALVLLDLGLPDLDGAEVARRLRATEDPARRLPIYALTGSDDLDERDAALGAGIDAILEKPLRAAALRALLEDPQHLDGRPEAIGATTTLPPPMAEPVRRTQPPSPF
jgi:CheY-like chemotaxis protein/anti-sigma regulatory factor (Ser/Thr protein kinase)